MAAQLVKGIQAMRKEKDPAIHTQPPPTQNLLLDVLHFPQGPPSLGKDTLRRSHGW